MLGEPALCQPTPSVLVHAAVGYLVSGSTAMASRPNGATDTIRSVASIEVTAVHVCPSGEVQSPCDTPRNAVIHDCATDSVATKPPFQRSTWATPCEGLNPTFSSIGLSAVSFVQLKPVQPVVAPGVVKPIPTIVGPGDSAGVVSASEGVGVTAVLDAALAVADGEGPPATFDRTDSNRPARLTASTTASATPIAGTAPNRPRGRPKVNRIPFPLFSVAWTADR